MTKTTAMTTTSDNNDDNKETLCAVFVTFFAVLCDRSLFIMGYLHACIGAGMLVITNKITHIKLYV